MYLVDKSTTRLANYMACVSLEINPKYKNCNLTNLTNVLRLSIDKSIKNN